MTPSEILRAGRDRVTESWKPGDTARALNSNVEYEVYKKAVFFLRAGAGIGPGDSLAHWDNRDATQAQAVAAYDRAIEFALSQETANV